MQNPPIQCVFFQSIAPLEVQAGTRCRSARRASDVGCSLGYTLVQHRAAGAPARHASVPVTRTRAVNLTPADTFTRAGGPRQHPVSWRNLLALLPLHDTASEAGQQPHMAGCCWWSNEPSEPSSHLAFFLSFFSLRAASTYRQDTVYRGGAFPMLRTERGRFGAVTSKL